MPMYNRSANQKVFKATKGEVSFGYQELDLICKRMWENDCLFNEQFTVEQLVIIYRKVCSLPSKYTLQNQVFPDCWEDKQVANALNGISPNWDEAGRPVY